MFQCLRPTHVSLLSSLGCYTRRAAYLQDCASILEIGGHRNPISEFITGPDILVVDPYTYSAHRNHTGCGLVRHLKATWESVMNSTGNVDCLLLLGSASAEPSSIISLVEQLQVGKVIFEIARHNVVVQAQWQATLRVLLKQFRLVAHLNLTIPSGAHSDAAHIMPVPPRQGDRELWMLAFEIN